MGFTLFFIQNAKPKEKPYKLAVGNGLHLLVQTGGNKFWRLRYRFAGKQNMLSLGKFPEVSLASARSRRDATRKLLTQDIDPSQQRKLDKIVAAMTAKNTFSAVAEDYLVRLTEEGKAETTIDIYLRPVR